MTAVGMKFWFVTVMTFLLVSCGGAAKFTAPSFAGVWAKSYGAGSSRLDETLTLGDDGSYTFSMVQNGTELVGPETGSYSYTDGGLSFIQKSGYKYDCSYSQSDLYHLHLLCTDGQVADETYLLQ